MHFQFDYLCSVTTYDIMFSDVVRYTVKTYIYIGTLNFGVQAAIGSYNYLMITNSNIRLLCS